MFTNVLLVGAAGFLGAVLRYGVNLAVIRWVGRPSLPLATFIVNVTGSFTLGWLLAFLASRTALPSAEPLRLAVAVGFLGAYTTFSTFAYESDALLRGGSFWMAAANVIGSVVAGVIAVRLGAMAGGR